jgi:hypothetical protein
MSKEKGHIISVKGQRNALSFFIRKAYDLSMENQFPITVELRKGSWEAIVYEAAPFVVEGIKQVAPFISVGTFAWKLLQYVKKRKGLILTDIGQDAARDKAIEILKTKYHLDIELLSETSEKRFFRFVFKYRSRQESSQKIVKIRKEDGEISVFEID